MIISASRRTDIPAFYPDWLADKVEKGELMVRNPMQEHQVGRIALSPDTIECFVFWTKNAAPMLDKLHVLDNKGYMYYFQHTLNYYGPEMEPNIPPVYERLKTFIELSKRIGKERVIWRYDPIVFTKAYTADWHVKCFSTLASILAPYTEKVVVSIVDIYPNKNYSKLARIGFEQPDHDDKVALLAALADIAHRNGLQIATCAENMSELAKFGIRKNSCIDQKLIERLIGDQLLGGKDNQRTDCGCMKCIDIGSYDTCPHGCIYCYANYNKNATASKMAAYDPSSLLLCGEIDPKKDYVYDRKVDSLRIPF